MNIKAKNINITINRVPYRVVGYTYGSAGWKLLYHEHFRVV